MAVKSFRRSIVLLLPLSGLLQGGGAAAPETGAAFKELDFTLSVVRTDLGAYQVPLTMDRPGSAAAGRESLPAINLDKSVLETDTVTVQAQARVGDLLRSRSIVPDGDALSVVYLLNPDVRNIDVLELGTPLVLPMVPPGKIAPGAQVELSLIPETKRELNLAAQAIDSLAVRFDKLPAERVGTPDERKKLTEALDAVRGYLGDLNALVEEKEMPLSPEMLVQSLDGARLVRETLDGALRPDGRWSAEDRQAIAGVAGDMTLKARNFDEIRGPGKSPTRWHDVRVVVAVVQLPGQKPVSDLRVFYAPQALVKKPSTARQFPGFSPQVAKRLIEADYVFWASSPGSSQPVTEELVQQIRRNPKDEIEIQIAVLPPTKGNR